MQSVNSVLVKCAVGLLALVPFPLLYLLSDGLYFFLYYILKYRRKVVEKNLHNSFPEKNKNEIKATSKKYYRHLADIIFESIKGLSLSSKEFQKRFPYLNPHIFPTNKSAILLGSHFGNWEWGVLSFPLSVEHNVLGIYKPLNNKALDIYLNNLRKKFGLHLAPMSKVGRAVVEYKNKPTIFVLINDQTPSDVVNAHWLDFLNQDTPFLHGADKLARQTKLPVYYFEIEKIKRGYYQVHFSKISEAGENITEGEITKRYTARLEKTIRENPSFWLWSHKRWKRSRPK